LAFLLCSYSAECVEGEFSELRHNGFLRSSLPQATRMQQQRSHIWAIRRPWRGV
jgi:hypothetical protein